MLSCTPKATRSLRCCGVMPSGPPAEPAGNEDIALAISSVETCSAVKRSELFGSHGVLLSIGAGGCLCLSAARVSGVSNAGLSSLQMRGIVDLKLPSSSLLATIDAKNLSGSYLLSLGLRFDGGQQLGSSAFIE